MRAYLRDQFPFLGVPSPIRRSIQKPTLVSLTDPDRLLSFVHACWSLEPRELQMVGVDALRRHQRRLRPEHLNDLRQLILTKSWWDTVDALAAHPVGHLVRTHDLRSTMDAWAASDELWLVRTAILHQLNDKTQTDDKRVFDYILAHADRTEFFLRKAQGWALRQYARVAPDTVRAFVDAHRHELSDLTVREATKRL